MLDWSDLQMRLHPHRLVQWISESVSEWVSEWSNFNFVSVWSVSSITELKNWTISSKFCDSFSLHLPLSVGGSVEKTDSLWSIYSIPNRTMSTICNDVHEIRTEGYNAHIHVDWSGSSVHLVVSTRQWDCIEETGLPLGGCGYAAIYVEDDQTWVFTGQETIVFGKK